jgi:signal transduction histidine kinase
MQAGTSVREFLEPVVECAERGTLGQVLDILHQGKPVAIRWATWRLLLPEAVVGYPPSRRVIDLPLRDVPLISPHLPVAEALISLREHNIPYALALEGSALRGMVSLRRLLEYVDRAERQQLAQKLQRSEHLVLLGQLASAVAHELRNPLGAMVLHMDILDEELLHPRPESRAQLLESWQAIKTNVTRLQEIVQDYLSLARLTVIQHQPADLGEFLEGFARELPERLAMQGITLQREGFDRMGAVAFHPSTFRRALLNLVQNAVEAMPQGGTLTLRGQGMGSQVQLEITDTGSGIPEDQLSRLFTPWHTTKPEGTGLGLYVVQEIVAAHGGTIQVHSILGSGTTFRITLPRAVSVSKAALQENAADP